MQVADVPADASNRVQSAHGVRLARDVFELLECVEDLPTDACGELVLEHEDAQRGLIFVEHGRVCWAAASGLSQRLSDLLRAQTRPALTRVEMESLFLRGHEQHTPLGELLVRSGLMEAGALLLALRRHSAESLVKIGRSPVTVRWRPRAPRQYAPGFTFLPVELALCVGAVLAECDPVASSVLLAPHDIAWGAVFALRGSATLPIATVGIPTVTALRRLAADARTDMDAAARIDGATSLVLTRKARDGGLMTWRERDLLFVGRMRDRSHFVRSLARLLGH